VPRVQRGTRRGGSDDSSIRIDSRDLYAFSADLKAAGGAKLVTSFKRELKAVAEPVAARVRSQASWSKRIPGAVGVSTRFTKRTTAVLVTVNRKKAPHARPLENDGKAGFFTHPIPVKAAGTRRGRLRQAVKGNTVQQQARPFFAKAVKSQDHRIDAAVERVAKDFEKRAGFR
jgi:hypothetical protein